MLDHESTVLPSRREAARLWLAQTYRGPVTNLEAEGAALAYLARAAEAGAEEMLATLSGLLAAYHEQHAGW